MYQCYTVQSRYVLPSCVFEAVACTAEVDPPAFVKLFVVKFYVVTSGKYIHLIETPTVVLFFGGQPLEMTTAVRLDCTIVQWYRVSAYALIIQGVRRNPTGKVTG